MLSCENVAFGTSQFLTFRNFGASFMSGAYVVLYGSNGVGTTSMLKMMSGSIKPTAGRITRKGNLSATFIGSDLDIKDGDTVENTLLRWAGHDREIIPIASEHFFLEDILSSKCRALSPGEKKRVALAKLMILRSDMWFLDRPFEQLDDYAADALLCAIAARTNNEGIVICAAGVDRKLDYYDQAIKICLDDFWD